MAPRRVRQGPHLACHTKQSFHMRDFWGVQGVKLKPRSPPQHHYTVHNEHRSQSYPASNGSRHVSQGPTAVISE
eukprot:3552822-Amphidinium_carterae.1